MPAVRWHALGARTREAGKRCIQMMVMSFTRFQGAFEFALLTYELVLAKKSSGGDGEDVALRAGGAPELAGVASLRPARDHTLL